MKLLERRAKEKECIVAVGSALVDILAHADDAFLEQTGAVKGGMTLVGKDFIESTLKLIPRAPSFVPGGSACNTAVGVARLGGQARFVGKCGNGQLGSLFRADLKKQNVEPAIFPSDSPTGRCLSIITPDAQRSMFTYLGAAAETKPEEITPACFHNAAIVHVEGYLSFNPDLILSALRTAKASGAAISLDLASHTVVKAVKESLEAMVDEYVDILIANEDEAQAFTGYSDEERAIRALGERAELAVLKVGARGSLVCHANRVIKVEPICNGPAVDTTGAGDLWASGFLYGLVKGYPLEKCGHLGSVCGAEVCCVVGASIAEEGWQRINQRLEDEWEN
jgi:sugar/nucleoside kinase (ribokinase family)